VITKTTFSHHRLAINYGNEKKTNMASSRFFWANFHFLDKKVGKIHEILWLNQTSYILAKFHQSFEPKK
jgi:hypothetical protein